MSTLPPPTPPKYTVKNPNANFFKAAVPFLAFCAIGAYFVSRFQSERLTMSDKQRSSMSLAEAKRRDEEIAAELERIQQLRVRANCCVLVFCVIEPLCHNAILSFTVLVLCHCSDTLTPTGSKFPYRARATIPTGAHRRKRRSEDRAALVHHNS